MVGVPPSPPSPPVVVGCVPVPPESVVVAESGGASPVVVGLTTEI
jgi:hypothetical protein